MRRKKWMLLAVILVPLFIFIGGEIVEHLWNWLAPQLFGLHTINIWEAFGLLILCRVLFGGWGGPRRHMGWRMRERMAQRWESMTPEERERFRSCMPGGARAGAPVPASPGAAPGPGFGGGPK
jgi:hypothetical protein